MDIKEIAEGCLAIWRNTDPSSMWLDSFGKYFSDDAVNVEPIHWEDFPPKVDGKKAIIEKYERTAELVEEHSYRFEGPFYDGKNRFAVLIKGDLSFRETGKRQTISEIGLYTVEDGKVVREEFFYDDALKGMWRELNDLWSKREEA